MTEFLDGLIQTAIRNHSNAIDQHVADYFGGSIDDAKRVLQTHPYRYVLIDGSPEFKYSNDGTKFVQETHVWFGTREDAIAAGFDVETEEQYRALLAEENNNEH